MPPTIARTTTTAAIVAHGTDRRLPAAVTGMVPGRPFFFEAFFVGPFGAVGGFPSPVVDAVSSGFAALCGLLMLAIGGSVLSSGGRARPFYGWVLSRP
ncbi:hypothetical protein GCM10009773_22930 [Williamsia serinedens]